jgi:hypothetical protein
MTREDIIDSIKEFFYRTWCRIKYKRFLDGKPFLCWLGFHNMRRGFGVSQDKRYDVCLRNGCHYGKWYNDNLIGWYRKYK